MKNSRDPFSPRSLFLVAAFALFSMGASCGQEVSSAQAQKPDQPTEDPGSRRKALDQSIHERVKDLACEKDSDCKTLPYGSKPCGGPWSYLIYSARAVPGDKEAQLRADVTQFNQLDQRIHQEEGTVSTCDVVPEPELSCKSGTCSQ